MKIKSLIFGSLALVLAIGLAFGCAPAAPTGDAGAAKIAALEDDLAAEEVKVKSLESDIDDLDDEIAALKKPVEVTTWRFQTWGGAEFDRDLKPIFESIEEVSGGRLKIDLYYGGSLVPNDKLLDAVRSGLVDAGHSTGAYWPSEIIIGNLESIAFSWFNHAQATRAYYGLGLVDLVREEYAENNTWWTPQLFAMGPSSDDLIMNAPVYNLDDLRKLKIRATGTYSRIFEKVGVSAVMIPWGEVYTSAATGIIDAAVYGNYTINLETGITEVLPYYLEQAMLAPYVCGFLVGEDALNALPEDLQGIAKLALEYTGWFKWAQDSDIIDRGSKEKLIEQGVVFTRLNDEDMSTLVEAAKEIWDEEGAKNARNKKAVDIIKQMQEEFGL